MSRATTSIEFAKLSTSVPLAVTHPPSIHAKNDRPQSLAEDVHPIVASANDADVEHLEPLKKRTTAVILVTIVCVTMISSMLSGVTTISLPTMARELDLAPNVLLW